MSSTYLTWLYVPGDRPDVVAKALGSGADVVLVDLEDAVAPDRKAYALDATADLLADKHEVPVHVRVNALDGPLAEREVRRLAPLPGLDALRLPKVNGPADLDRIADWAAEVPPLYALLESALGVERAYDIASHPAVRGIALGEADLRADLGVTDATGLSWVRGRAVVAARAAQLPPPPQSVYPDVRDTAGLARSCAEGRALGFLGRTAIHPRQLPVIEEAFRPTEAEVAAARDIVSAADRDPGALALPDGRFVDAAVVAGARRTLQLAER
ncbi:HpcH/HpaI aldolase/citrate lyase family protein [Streptomyces sp. SID8379]|uniref:HpcH/HpaI aldolase/citrate lyase family protein n=1 Tax=unclassified Streptomyces TaxID=2593676 RepID=UPI0003671E83|nr:MULTISPECIES: CoA ester lyase [unclassified Streptomyces]MYW66329.1 HpcH/HpaI aldolase/citrate lyase family protein [Streptomyces sp. SID8379]